MNNFNETTVENTISILRDSRAQYQVHYQVKINDTALVAAAILADRYLSGKTLDLLDRAAIKFKQELSSKLLELNSNDRKIAEREIDRLQNQLETIDLEIQQAERNYNLRLVAELRYDELPKIQRTIEAVRAKLDRLSSVDLSGCEEELSERDIARIVAELTGNSIDRILNPDLAKLPTQDQKIADITERLLRDRIIFLGTEIDNKIANKIMAQLLFLEAEDSEKDIYLYINSSGGSVSAGIAILDMIEYVLPDVCTVCMDFAGGISGLLLSAGAKGKRMSLPTGKMVLNKPSLGATENAMDMTVQMKEVLYVRTKINNLLATYTGQSPEKIDRDTDCNFYLNAAEAKEYGLIDTIIDRRPK